MYSLTIHFGPNAMTWAFLFKEKDHAQEARIHAIDMITGGDTFYIEDDFGQQASFGSEVVHGVLLEDLDLVEAARIQRSLAEERCKVKLMNAARTDPVIGPAIRGGGAPVLTPLGGFRQ